MKKTKTFHECSIHVLRKTFRIMRITLFLIFAVILQSFANESYSQKTRLTLSFSKTKLVNVLDEIEKNSEFFFLFNEKLVDTNREVSVSFENKKVDEILDKLFDGTDIVYTISDRKIILAPKLLTENPQKQTFISGTVTDEAGEPIPGVTVLIKGTTNGTVTNVDGNYSISNVPGNATLQFSFVGMLTQEVEVGNQATIDITMKMDAIGIEEVVAVGYGTQLRTEVSGSIVSISPQSFNMESLPTASIETALQGRLAGVNVAESNGDPGSASQIRIRGTGSISAGNDPLYVIDGVPISQNHRNQLQAGRQRSSFPTTKINPLATLNTNDIESIEVLKDASAAAIYGSRGSNGVILITTKRGKKEQAPQITFSTTAGVQTPFNVPDLMNAEELIEFTKDARNNTYLRQQDPTNPSSPFYNPDYSPDNNNGRAANGATGMHLIPEAYVNWDGTDTDWLSLVLSNSILQNYNLSVSGGSEKSTYFLGVGHMNQTGIIEGSGFKRYSINTNLTTYITDKLDINLALNAALTDHNRKAASAPYFADPPGIIYSAMTQSPVISPYLDDGVTFAQTDNSHNRLGGGMTTTNHPLAVMEYINDHLMNNRIYGNLNANYEIIDNLKFKSLLGFDLDQLQRSFYQGTQLYYRGGDPRPIAQADGAMSFNWLWENTLNYSKEFNADNKLTALVGFTAQKQRDERNRVVAEQFPDDQVQTVGGGIITGGSQSIEEWSLISMLARFNYVFKSKYLLTATIRSDRSSRFGAENQTGIFPSFSLGWLLHKEGFMQNQSVINTLKPRFSYGVTGNFLIPNYGSIGLLTNANYVIGGAVVPGAIPISFSNRELTWETTRQFNVGLDFALLENRMYGTFDWYRSHTTDLLLNVNIPAVTGFTSTLANIGKVENKGFEVQISSRNIVGDFNWTTDVNFSINKNEVLALGPEKDPILVKGAAGIRHITRIGDPIGSYYGYEVVGIFQTQEEINNAPVDTQGDPTPGDFQFRDVNGDGFITPDDRTVIGSYHPDFVWGINNSFAFKNFDFSIFFNGVEGREVLNLTRRHLFNGEANFNSYALLNERWRSPEDPGNGKIPKADRISGGNNNRPSSYQVEDGSYIKLKNITLGYNIPKGKLPVQSLRVFASVSNVAIWTDYIGFNPEVNLAQGASLTSGEDYGAYPLSRAFQVGVNVTF